MRGIETGAVIFAGVVFEDPPPLVGVEQLLAGVTFGVTTTSSLRSTTMRDLVPQDENDGFDSEPKGIISSLKHKFCISYKFLEI